MNNMSYYFSYPKTEHILVCRIDLLLSTVITSIGFAPKIHKQNGKTGVTATVTPVSYPFESVITASKHLLCRGCPEIHLLFYVPELSDIQKIAVFLKSSVCIVSKDSLCQNFSKLNTFLVEAVYIPQEALEHYLVLEMSKECTKCSRIELVTDYDA